MARRLLGADNAATVFSTQQTEEEPATQVHTLNNILRLLQCGTWMWDQECLLTFAYF